MHASLLLLALNVLPALACLPGGAEKPIRRNVPRGLSTPKDGMRLIKTTPEDPGSWYTEDEKFEHFVSQHLHFVDATETADLESLGFQSFAALADLPTSLSKQAVVTPLLSQVTTSNIAGWLTPFTTYNNRYYKSTTGAQASTWLFNTVKTVVAGTNISVTQYTHSAFTQKSIIARIPGTSADKIVIGAHLDSVGSTATGRSPGADDNASGSFTILEALRILSKSGFKPKNTLEFHWYAGEEGGLLGSRDIFRSYAASSTSVIAMLNQDMTGYSPKNQMSIITDYTDAGLNAFVKMVAEEYGGLEVVESKCGYACSDHGSAMSAGYRGAFLFEAKFGDHSPYIHTANDAVSTVNLQHVAAHVKATIGFAVEAAAI